MSEFLGERFGPGVRRKALAGIGDPVFLATDSYPDAALGQMADLASSITGGAGGISSTAWGSSPRPHSGNSPAVC